MRLVSITKGIVVAATAAFLMACGGGPADKLMGAKEKVVSIIEDNKTDLDKAAKEIGEYIASNKDSLKAAADEMEKQMKTASKEEQDKLEEKYKSRTEALKARMEKLEKDVPAIKENAALKSVLNELD